MKELCRRWWIFVYLLMLYMPSGCYRWIFSTTYSGELCQTGKVVSSFFILVDCLLDNLRASTITVLLLPYRWSTNYFWTYIFHICFLTPDPSYFLDVWYTDIVIICLDLYTLIPLGRVSCRYIICSNLSVEKLSVTLLFNQKQYCPK